MRYAYVLTESFHAHGVAGQGGQVKRRGPEIVNFGQVSARVHQQLYQISVPFVWSPVQRGVAINIGQMVLCAHSQQEARRRRLTEHAGRHQRRQTFEVRNVCIHSSLYIKRNETSAFKLLTRWTMENPAELSFVRLSDKYYQEFKSRIYRSTTVGFWSIGTVFLIF